MDLEALEDRRVLAHFVVTSDCASGTTNGASGDVSDEFNGTGQDILSIDSPYTPGPLRPGGNATVFVTLNSQGNAFLAVSVYDFAGGAATASVSATLTIEPDTDIGEQLGDPVTVVIQGFKSTDTSNSTIYSSGALGPGDIGLSPFPGPGTYLSHIGDSIDATLTTTSTSGALDYVDSAEKQAGLSLEPPPPDISVDSAEIDPSSGLPSFGYSIAGTLPTTTTIDAYWASGNDPSTIIGSPIYTLPTGTASNSYGPFTIPQDDLNDPPPGASTILVFADPKDTIVESDKTNNFMAIPLTDIAIDTLSIDPSSGLPQFTYSITGTLPTTTTIDAYWASGTTPARLSARPFMKRRQGPPLGHLAQT